VVIEAMRFSRPVILTDQIAAARELVADGESGYIVAPDDPDRLADRLQTLAESRPLRERMGAIGLERSRAYTPEFALRELEDVYQRILG
jgi:D-inositol-3-phosphate glycosyltransferase